MIELIIDIIIKYCNELTPTEFRKLVFIYSKLQIYQQIMSEKKIWLENYIEKE